MQPSGKGLATGPSARVAHHGMTHALSAFSLNDLALIAAEEGDHTRAVELFRQAIEKSERHAFIFSNCALSLRDLGEVEQARTMLLKAIELEPTNATVLFNLANIHYELGDLRQALATYDQALSQRADFPQAIANYALIALEADEIALAKRLATRGVGLVSAPDPIARKLHVVLANIDSLMGFHKKALKRMKSLLQSDQSPENLVEVTKLLALADPDDLTEGMLEFVELALAQKWAAPESIVAAVWPKVTHQYQLLETNRPHAWPKLALEVLSNVVISDTETETWLTQRRAELLLRRDNSDLERREIAFFAALAQQCFLKNYLFDDRILKLPRITSLADRIRAMILEGADVAPLLVLKYAARASLHTIPEASRLLELGRTDVSIASLLRQQIVNPLAERAIESTIPNLSTADFEDAPVARRYHDHPYPQWSWTRRVLQTEPFNLYLRQRLGHSKFAPLTGAPPLRLLVAGCGTGRHSHALAHALSESDITALDISRSSLAFGKRKALEDGLLNISYVQADLMHLSDWEERFDVIECAGVLHHLEDPVAGLKILSALLKPRGVIMLALYSERARRAIHELRNVLAYDPAQDEIERVHRAREMVMRDRRFASIMRYQDFYTMNGCLDLLAHPRETAYRPRQIEALLDSQNLSFLGFELSSKERAAFRSRFRSKDDLLDLNLWDAHEMDHPQTFAAMYHFWAQKVV